MPRKIKPYGIIYKATSRDGRVYIGQTTETLIGCKADHLLKLNDVNTAFHTALIEQGFMSFTWEQIDTADSQEEANKKEKQQIAYYQSDNPAHGYNFTVPKPRYMPSKETCRKISEAKKGFTHSEETRQRISKANKGKKKPPRTAEHCRRISEVHKGMKHTPETRKKLSEIQKGKKRQPHTAETRRKIGEANKGRKHSEETRRKLSEANKGKKHTPETREKMSQSHSGKKLSQETRLKVSEARKKYFALKKAKGET